MSESHALEEMQEQFLKQAMAELFITDDTFFIDATHIKARNQAPAKQERKNLNLKRGRKSKAEREAWLERKQEEEKQSQYILGTVLSSGNLNN